LKFAHHSCNAGLWPAVSKLASETPALADDGWTRLQETRRWELKAKPAARRWTCWWISQA